MPPKEALFLSSSKILVCTVSVQSLDRRRSHELLLCGQRIFIGRTVNTKFNSLSDWLFGDTYSSWQKDTLFLAHLMHRSKLYCVLIVIGDY